ncbi:relA-associated inhibitor [Stigmatopora argus]
MTSQNSYGSSLLFQTMNEDLNASFANADALANQFDSMLKDASGSKDRQPRFQSSHCNILPPPDTASGWTTIGYASSAPNKSSPVSSPRIGRSTTPRGATDGQSYRQMSPKHSPHGPRRSYDNSPRGSASYAERSPSPAHSPISHLPLPSPKRLSPFDGRRSPRPERVPSPLAFHHPAPETLPRAFTFRQADEGTQRQKSPNKWNETDLDTSFESKPHHTYDKSEWLRTSVPNSNWRESNLDGPAAASSSKKNHRGPPVQFPQGSLSRNTRVTVLPDVASPSPSQQYHQQPIISRISIPPVAAQSRQRRPIPLSVIMRLQNPQWGGISDLAGPPGDPWEAHYQPSPSRNFFSQAAMHPPPELRQPAVYSDALNPGDIDAELSRREAVHHMPPIREGEGGPPGGPPRPLSPTRLQPVVAPEAQSQEIPDLEELLRIRSEIPRPLKRRGSADPSRPNRKASHYEPNQYKKLINKLFRRKGGSETGTSSEDEDTAALPPPRTPSSTSAPHDYRNYHSILRAGRDRKSSGRRARLSPLVLALDGALVGELETVQRAVQEMPDPSQSNDEGITALHNAICGGHYNVVDFLVRAGANVSAPDSHGWTPLHCAASCNDRPLCEFLVRNGAAVMAMTESDGATAAQKCDPYAVGFEGCESFLRGMEEAMGMENSGVLYALWSYPAQAPDELSFREGDMVTILQKADGSDWWWASLCGREGFVPNNYFGLFPKVRPKSLS